MIIKRKRSLFRKETHRQTLPIPAPFTAADIRVESSICTGERTIGFYDRSSQSLRYAELVQSAQDIRDFYERYGAAVPEQLE